VVDNGEQAVGEVDLEQDDLDQIDEGDIDFDKGPLNRKPWVISADSSFQ
jgi:hypothetical protein